MNFLYKVIYYFEKKMRNMSLIEHAIRTTFSTLDYETKKKLIDEFTIDCYGINHDTIKNITDISLKSFALFIRNSKIMGNIKNLSDVRQYFNRYERFKEICTGGYAYCHYNAGGYNVY